MLLMLLKKSRFFALDLCPRALLCAGGTVELLISSGAGRYLEFLSMEALCVLESADDDNGKNLKDSGARMEGVVAQRKETNAGSSSRSSWSARRPKAPSAPPSYSSQPIPPSFASAVASSTHGTASASSSEHAYAQADGKGAVAIRAAQKKKGHKYHAWRVPCSKRDIFSSKDLPRSEKLVLMKFLRHRILLVLI